MHMAKFRYQKQLQQVKYLFRKYSTLCENAHEGNLRWYWSFYRYGYMYEDEIQHFGALRLKVPGSKAPSRGEQILRMDCLDVEYSAKSRRMENYISIGPEDNLLKLDTLCLQQINFSKSETADGCRGEGKRTCTRHFWGV